MLCAYQAYPSLMAVQTSTMHTSTDGDKYRFASQCRYVPGVSYFSSERQHTVCIPVQSCSLVWQWKLDLCCPSCLLLLSVSPFCPEVPLSCTPIVDPGLTWSASESVSQARSRGRAQQERVKRGASKEMQEPLRSACLSSFHLLSFPFLPAELASLSLRCSCDL